MSRTVLYLANYFDVMSVSKNKSLLKKLTGVPITNHKLKRYTWAGLTYCDEHLSLKLNKLFPQRVQIRSFVLEHGRITPLEDEENIEL